MAKSPLGRAVCSLGVSRPTLTNRKPVAVSWHDSEHLTPLVPWVAWRLFKQVGLHHLPLLSPRFVSRLSGPPVLGGKGARFNRAEIDPRRLLDRLGKIPLGPSPSIADVKRVFSRLCGG